MELDPEKLKAALREVLSEPGQGLSAEVHREHHLWMERALPKLEAFLDYRDVRMKQLQKRHDIWLKVRDTAIGSLVVTIVLAVIGALSWVGMLVVNAFQHWVQSGHSGIS
jgi:hypothetical protein